ncbi:hypothetical protein [Streptomyces sp. URMC 124]|uniref:hypothetical protein n=1 Tax=Streptomyces sp. URMC 124 TaxID=3423405 RepID=UPI003F1BEBEE
MKAGKSLALATATVALGAGLAVTAPSAQAEPAARSVVTQTADLDTGVGHGIQASWKRIWGPYKHTPTKYWPTGDFVPRSNALGVHARCWNGGDGTKLKIDIVRSSDKKVIAKGGWGVCTGDWMNVDTFRASPNQKHYMRIYLSGKPHTIEARAYHKV